MLSHFSSALTPPDRSSSAGPASRIRAAAAAPPTWRGEATPEWRMRGGTEGSQGGREDDVLTPLHRERGSDGHSGHVRFLLPATLLQF